MDGEEMKLFNQDLICGNRYDFNSSNAISGLTLVVMNVFALVLFSHSLESYTAIPYNERSPRPANPRDRPTYQGSNPISDIWAKEALRVIGSYFKRYAETIIGKQTEFIFVVLCLL